MKLGLVIPFTEMARGRTVRSIGVVSAFPGVTGKRFSSFFSEGFSEEEKKW